MNTPTADAAPPTVITMARRFRGYLPVVIDVETGGFNSATDALLEIAAVLIDIDAAGTLKRGESWSFHVRPFAGSNIDAAALAVNGIDPHHPLRPAIDERDALTRVFTEVRKAMKPAGCKRAILVGHNAAFDLGFLNAALARTAIKRSPFHPFSCFDTATLAGAALGQTVLAKAARVAGMDWDAESAHSARYDAERTADLFCVISNGCHAQFLQADARARALGFVDPDPPVPPLEADSPGVGER